MMLRIAIAAGVLAGCAVEAAPDKSFVDKVRAAQVRMHSRFEAAQRLQMAIAVADLPRAREEARRIVALPEPEALAPWRTYIDNVRVAARRIDGAKTTLEAASASVELGRECAKCHVAGNTRISFAKQPQPPDSPKLANQMFAHQWAAARMWEGVIGPSDEQWKLGATELAGARLTIAAESGELGIANDIARIRLLARRALDPKATPDRPAIFGDLLRTCVHCHFTIREGAL